MTIRHLEEKDLDVICEIEQASFTDPWSRQGFLDCLKLDHVITLVILEGERVAGYGCLYLVLGEGDIMNIAIAAAFWGRGLGGRLLDELLRAGKLKGAETFFLEVRKSNVPAINLYTSRGFKQIAVRKDFYQKPMEDALVMKLNANTHHP